MTPPRFITLEGIDGAGKSTHLVWLQAYLQDHGIDAVVTREPGGTHLGEQLRALLLDNQQVMHPDTEALMMFAARREHLDKVILPALERGHWVISDRFTDASFAYQGGGRGVATDRLEQLEQWVQGTVQPDLTLYFDVTVELGRQRISTIKTADRFEQEQDDFFRRVRDAYLERARQFPHRIHLVDSAKPVKEIQKLLEDIISSLCQ